MARGNNEVIMQDTVESLLNWGFTVFCFMQKH